MLTRWTLFVFCQLLNGIIATSLTRLDRQYSRGSSRGSFSTMSDSPLTLPPSTPKSVSLAYLTARDEDLVIWKALFCVPEFTQSLFDEFAAFEGDLDAETLLWPKLAAFAALKELKQGGDELIDQVITPRLLSLHSRSLSTSDETVLDVWDTILASFPESILNHFRFPEDNSHYIRNVILQGHDSLEIFQNFADYLDRLGIDPVKLPTIMTFGIKRFAGEDGRKDFAVGLPAFLHVGVHVYERIVSIAPADPLNPDSPFSCWFKNLQNSEWNVFAFRDDLPLESALDELYDTKTVLALYRKQAQTSADPKVSERLAEYALKQLAQDPLQRAILNAEATPLLGAILACILGDEGLLESFKGFESAHALALVDLYDRLLGGETLNLADSDLLRVIHDRVPLELAISLPELWIQLCRFILPVDTGIQVQLGKLLDGSFLLQNTISTSIAVIAPNDHLGLAEGNLAITYRDLQTRLFPIGNVFAIAVNRVPIRGELLDANLDISDLDNELAKVSAFVCFDQEAGGFYTFFWRSRNWVRYQSGSVFELLPRSEATQSLIQHELAQNSVFILFHYLGESSK